MRIQAEVGDETDRLQQYLEVATCREDLLKDLLETKNQAWADLH